MNDGYGYYDEDFACCGGCSSYKRADAYNDKLESGAKIFIWDIKLKVDPAEVCLLTFPYDPSRNEQVGARRVRSGRLVGSTYPIDHDYDFRCCEQRGQCHLLEEDASGACQCVKRWGFTGDHCQYSIYEVAQQNNSAIFPLITNLSSVNYFLPDLRGYLLSFDHASAISSWSSSTRDHPVTVLDAFQTGSYFQYCWSSGAFFIVAAAVVLLMFLLHLMWTVCCFSCGCRKRDLGKRPKIYAKYQKILWGLAMLIHFVIATAAAVYTFLIIHSNVDPLTTEAVVVVNNTLTQKLYDFKTAFLTPLDEIIMNGYHGPDGVQISLEHLQDISISNLVSHTFLENQTYATDEVSEPLFAIINSLLDHAQLFPTASENWTDCSNMNITPSVVSRMTIGGESSCFKCKLCAQIPNTVESTTDYWRRNPFQIQMDMVTSQRQLKEFGEARDLLVPSLQDFLDRVHVATDETRTSIIKVASELNAIITVVRNVTIYSLFALMGLGGLSLFLAVVAFVHGILTNKRVIGRTTCCFVELTALVAFIACGILYTVVWMSHDGITSLQLLDESTSRFIPSTLTADHAWMMLFDKDIVSEDSMDMTLAFSDTLRIPPLPTPTDDNPERFNVSNVYYLAELFQLEAETADNESALILFFGWSESFVETRHGWLMTLAFGNDSVTSPYNQSLHQDLLNSSVGEFIDPDMDSIPVTESDFEYIQQVFNDSWRGIDDLGVRQNKQIANLWHFIARLYVQKQHLMDYIATLHRIVASVHPLLDELIEKTAAMEEAEFQLKAPVEYVTDTIRQAKIQDCSYNGNCRWFRDVVNDLFRIFQAMITHLERATVACAISAVSFLLATICTNGFTSRLRRNIVKVYSGR